MKNNICEKFGKSGTFFCGCNYWASDWGIEMWSHFDADVVRRDFTALAQHGIRLLRVFPLWSHFQPLEAIYGYCGVLEGYSIDGGATLIREEADAAIVPQAMEDFGTMLDIAEELGICVIPSIITGWMSGRLFVPPVMQGKDILTDPFALKWEARFVRQFVRAFRDRPNIVGWCLGNECNCCGKVENESQAWIWTALLTDAIRANDATRPVISGMHSLSAEKEGVWTMAAQGENCDFLTTHPYASPTYKTDSIPADNFRAVIHPACQNAMYSDLSGKPSFIEEAGTFGEMYCDEVLTAVYAKNVLFNAWAQDARAHLWWIAFDQGHLRYHPFGFNNRASNYGLLRTDFTEKPILGAIKEFSSFVDSFPYETLPPAIVDGVCLIPDGAVSWQVGSGAFNLAAEAGMNLRFAPLSDQIPDAPLYLLPSLDTNSVPVTALDALMEKVKNGAVLYVSVGGGLLRNLCRDFGFHINRRYDISGAEKITLADGGEITLTPTLRYDITPTTARVLASAPDGTPVFTVADYGKGKLLFFACPMEKQLFAIPTGYERGHYRIYEAIRRECTIDRLISRTDPYVTVTEHPTEAGRIIVAVNNSAEPRTVVCTTDARLTAVYRGNVTQRDTLTLTIPANEAAVFEVRS